MPTSPLPGNPSLEHLRKDAKRLHKAVQARDPAALACVHEFHPLAGQALPRFTLADAQLVTARSYGFASWAKLKQHLVESAALVWNVPPPPDLDSRVDVFIRLACLTYTAMHPSPARARRMLTDHPEIARASTRTFAIPEGNPLVFYLHPEMKRLNDMIRLLVKHGADLNAQDGNGKTLLARALAHELTDFADALRGHGATA